MKADFTKTVDILVKAYLNGTLAHKLCTACAVGNIVSAVNNTTPIVSDENCTTEFNCWNYTNGDRAYWYDVIGDHPIPESIGYIKGLQQIESTGYTVDEIRAIEYAFEHAPGDPGDSSTGIFRGRCVDPVWMFNGLMAVVDALADIHGINLQQKESAKLLFVK